MPRFPQVLENVEVARGEGLEGAAGVWEAVRRAEEALGEGGRVLVRASGTEPLVRVMVEAQSHDDAARHAADIAREVRAALG
jgi:phosphoglucosamine mutase